MRLCLSVTVYSQNAVVPEDTDGFGALLSGDQAELHSDGFLQCVLQQLVVVVHCDAHHWCVDNRALWDTEKQTKKNVKNNVEELDQAFYWTVQLSIIPSLTADSSCPGRNSLAAATPDCGR